jgi:hypothetical protein
MTPRPSTRASTCVGLQFKLFEKLRLGSYPRRPHRDSAGAHCPSDCQPFWQFAVPGIAEVTSPAGIARRPDGTTPFEHRSIRHRAPLIEQNVYEVKVQCKG